MRVFPKMKEGTRKHKGGIRPHKGARKLNIRSRVVINP